MFLANSKLYKNNRTTIPIEVRKKHKIDTNEDDITILWCKNNNGETVVNFKKNK